MLFTAAGLGDETAMARQSAGLSQPVDMSGFEDDCRHAMVGPILPFDPMSLKILLTQLCLDIYYSERRTYSQELRIR
jgi:hypothetical protein